MTIDDGGQRSLRPACVPIDTEGPRFKVLAVTGFRIRRSGRISGQEQPGLSATVIDTFYSTEHGTFASWDVWVRDVPRKPDGKWVAPEENDKRSARRGSEGALLAAAERCAELNAWHEREGWEDDPPEALSRCQGQAARAG